ncbi:MAG: YfhO family protein [Cyclobacteriaceae bacterium]
MTLGKKVLHHLLPLAIFFVVASVFFGPLYTGKVLVQSDNIQLTGVNKEVNEYKEKGEDIRWNNREFSGGPVQRSSDFNPMGIVNRILLSDTLIPKPIMMMVYLFFGMYLLLHVLGVSRWLATIGAFAYAFSTFNIISIEVGHDNKVLAMAFMAPVIAGVIWAYRGELLKGGLVTTLAAGFQLYFGHVQITYYSLIMVIGYLVVVIYQTIQSKDWSQFFKISGVLAFATIIGLGCNFANIYGTFEYVDYSTRGGSDLTSGEAGNVSSDGLDKDYALAWSSGKMEALTILFPYFHGGASSERLSENSDTYEALKSRGVDQRTLQNVTGNLPLYWGTQPFTGGPIYFGAIVCFLFILGLLSIRGPLKWWALGLTVLSLFLAMGKNLEWFTDIFFYYIPLYNKFRSVTMIFSITQLTLPILGIVILDRLIKGEFDQQKVIKSVIQSAGVVIGLGLVLIVFKSSFFDFKGQNDAAYGFPQWLVDAIVSDRKRLFVNDIIRSIVFVGLAAGMIWLYLKKLVKVQYLIASLAILILIDLWGVNKRYLGSDDFQPKRKISQTQFQPSVADQQILQDESYYRVLNLTSQNPFSDGVTSYFHYSVLGYSAIKMQRYQEIIDRYMRDMNKDVLGMLNAKYFIVNGQNGPQAQLNSSALGNAWMVKSLISAENADDELESIGTLNLKEEAVFDKRFENSQQERSYTAVGSVSLKSYHPEEMVYDFSSDSDQFVVFSEIYYAPGWKAYIDGDEVPHIRVNYVLRGLEVPAGDHEVVFKYQALSVGLGDPLAILCSILLLVGAPLLIFRKSRKSI